MIFHDSIDEKISQEFDEEISQEFDEKISQEFDEEKEAKNFLFSNESKYLKIVQAFTLKVYIDKRHHVIIKICWMWNMKDLWRRLKMNENDELKYTQNKKNYIVENDESYNSFVEWKRVMTQSNKIKKIRVTRIKLIANEWTDWSDVINQFNVYLEDINQNDQTSH